MDLSTRERETRRIPKRNSVVVVLHIKSPWRCWISRCFFSKEQMAGKHTTCCSVSLRRPCVISIFIFSATVLTVLDFCPYAKESSQMNKCYKFTHASSDSNQSEQTKAWLIVSSSRWRMSSSSGKTRRHLGLTCTSPQMQQCLETKRHMLMVIGNRLSFYVFPATTTTSSFSREERGITAMSLKMTVAQHLSAPAHIKSSLSSTPFYGRRSSTTTSCLRKQKKINK